MRVFNELTICSSSLSAVDSISYESATQRRTATMTHDIDGKEAIGQAQTGTGKTAAFGIPMIERFDSQGKDIQGLVVAPTRELAIQVAAEINRIGKFKRIRALAVYGGQHMDRQIRALKDRPQIVVATPGRLLDHLRRRTIRLHAIKVAVLDEADEMLNMGFI